MTKIYLARHGQDLDNAAGILNGRRDQPLTILGQNQAHQLAGKILETGIRFDKIYSSPLLRSYETAQIISTVLEMDHPEKLELLIERDFGIMSGVHAQEITSRCAPNSLTTETITYFLSPEGAETFPQLLGRAKILLKTIQEKHQPPSILLVTHGDFGKMLYAAFYGLEWQEVLSAFHFGNSELLLLEQGAEPERRKIFDIQQFNF